MKKIKKNIILLFIITIIILYFILKDEYEAILSALLNSNLVYVYGGVYKINFIIFNN